MSILEELNTLVTNAGLPVETGIFSGTAPDEYVVITPISDHFELFSDDAPGMNIEEVRLSLFSKNNYCARKRQLIRLLLSAGFLVSERRYIGLEEDTGYHHFAIDVAKEYMEEA